MSSLIWWLPSFDLHHLTIFGLLCSTVYSTSPLGRQICISNITHPNTNSWLPQSTLLSQLSSFQLMSTSFKLFQPKILKDLESSIQKDSLCSILFLLEKEMSKYTQPKSSYHFYSLLFFWSSPWSLFLDYCNIFLIVSVYSLLIFHPHPLSLLFALTFKMYIRSYHSFFLKISRILLRGKFKDVNRNYKFLKYVFHFSLPSLCHLFSKYLVCSTSGMLTSLPFFCQFLTLEYGILFGGNFLEVYV